MAKKKQLFLGVRDQPAGYGDGGVYVGIAPEDNTDSFSADERRRAKDQITVAPLNGKPLLVVTHRSTYDDR